MNDLNAFFELKPYELAQEQKKKLLTDKLLELTRYHYAHCEQYRNILDAIGYLPEKTESCYDIPFFLSVCLKRWNCSAYQGKISLRQ